MDSVPFATLIAIQTYRTTGDAEMAMRFFREYGGMEA